MRDPRSIAPINISSTQRPFPFTGASIARCSVAAVNACVACVTAPPARSEAATIVASTNSASGMNVDTVRTLRRNSYRNRDQLFVFHGDRTIGYGRFVERPERLHHFWCERVHPLNSRKFFLCIDLFHKWFFL
jgi:hypothetical protein